VEDATALVLEKKKSSCGYIQGIPKTAVSWYYSKQ